MFEFEKPFMAYINNPLYVVTMGTLSCTIREYCEIKTKDYDQRRFFFFFSPERPIKLLWDRPLSPMFYSDLIEKQGLSFPEIF